MGSRSDLRTRRKRLERERFPIPHIEKWIADGGCAPKAFVFDQYGNPIRFNMQTVRGREGARVYLPTEQADDLLANPHYAPQACGCGANH